ncbi:hypothetical protein Taro_025700 [Colocasia esculenta]|uniref:Uncharacterized protein n=1 Tax=Colocasia esculenta TaxID=4460 RepID=A0A843VIC6_COLES|nr:hypothetical protein [Colocasia esculenta]
MTPQREVTRLSARYRRRSDFSFLDSPSLGRFNHVQGRFGYLDSPDDPRKSRRRWMEPPLYQEMAGIRHLWAFLGMADFCRF